MSSVGIIILNYKVANEALKCIRSVQESDYPNYQIYVVDNNSGDEIEQNVRNLNVKFIQNRDNLGYAGGNNVGIKKAIEDQMDYILVLNPDTQITLTTISKMVSCIEKANVGIVGPKIYFEGTKKIWFAGGKFDKQNVLGSHIGVDESDLGQYDQLRKVDFITGAAIMIKTQVFKDIGLFDERYFLYLEDVDFCYRAKLKGYPSYYQPSALVYHQNAKSTGLGSNLQNYFITRNRMLFAKKFLSFRTLLALFREAISNLGDPVRRLAIFDFLIGKFGKGSFAK